MPRFASVVLDCDSTLCAVEGIEELAVAHRAEIARLTEAAMRGEVPLESVYARRLDLVRPSRQAVEALGRRYVATLLPDTRAVIRALVDEGVAVYFISGGLRPAVLALARELGVPEPCVAAVDVAFTADGAYHDFDRSSPLARAEGKREVLASWRGRLARPVLLVGDGATDLAAKPEVDLFAAFAGVIARPAVTRGADLVIHAPSLAPVLAIALGEPPADPGRRRLFDRGMKMLVADRKS